MRTDMEIQKDVVAELRWEPSLRDAERAARNAPGVTGVENNLTVDGGVYVDV
jgi:hypothetical protein